MHFKAIYVITTPSNDKSYSLKNCCINRSRFALLVFHKTVLASFLLFKHMIHICYSSFISTIVTMNIFMEKQLQNFLLRHENFTVVFSFSIGDGKQYLHSYSLLNSLVISVIKSLVDIIGIMFQLSSHECVIFWVC